MIELQPVAAYHGPSPVAMEPIVVAEMMADPGSYARLAAAIPALQSATADWYSPGALPHESVPAQRVGAFVADWALQALTYVNGYLHAHGCLTDPATGRALVWVGFHDPQISLAALALGAQWLAAVAEDRHDSGDWSAQLDELWSRCRLAHPDYQARIVMEAARARDVPYSPAWGAPRLWCFGQGFRSRVLFESNSCDDGRVGSWVSESKSLSKNMFRALGVPTPEFRLVHSEGELEQAVAEVGFPCVTKPIDQGGGKGVSTALTTMDTVRDGYAAARAYTSGPIMVEAHVTGEDHRLMVVDGRLAVALRREPPHVTGDGRSTIADLVAAKNVGRDRRSLVRSGYLRPIVLDASAVLYLSGQGLDPGTVLADGQTVRVRGNANLSTGGDCIDVTPHVHPGLRVMAETLARTLNLAMVGLDVLTTDISGSPAESGAQIIEINITPGLDGAIAAGWPVERSGDMALGHTPGRIPLRLFIISDDAMSQVLSAMRSWQWMSGRGWATWDHAAESGVELAVAPGAAWPGVRALLAHRTIARAVLVATDAQIHEYGLPQDRFFSVHAACALNPLWRGVIEQCCDTVVDVDPTDVYGALLAVVEALI